MFITLSPFFYFIANQKNIEDYVGIASGGRLPYHLPSTELKQLVGQYIEMNSHGVDESNKNSYILYICDQLCGGKNMFTRHKIYYTIEMKDDDRFNFVCSYSNYSDAESKLRELRSISDNEYRILKIEKDIEEIE